MAARRLILAMLVLLVLSTILATLVPVDPDRLRDDTTSSTAVGAQAPSIPPGELVKRKIAVDDATPEVIELGRGDQLELTVTSSKLADRVEIPAFGDSGFVDPEFPAHFDLLALEVGSFPVRLVEADREIARLEVSEGQSGAEGKPGDSGKSSDSPGSSKASSTPGASSAS
jgi:hypothetical protein